MNKISNELVEDFNSILRGRSSVIKLYKIGYSVDIKLIEDDFLKMEDQIINPSKEFYNTLETFFKNKGVNITYNNTGSCFWSN